MLLGAIVLTSGCGDSQSGAQGQGQQPGGQSASQCASGMRMIGVSDYGSSSPGGGTPQYGSDGARFLADWGLSSPLVCAEVTDQQLAGAASQVAEQFPEMCAIVGPRNYRDNAALLSQKLPADQVDAAVAAFSSATGGNPVGKYVGSDTGSGHRVSADDPGAMTDPFMRNESAERAVQNALIAFCP
ncbi:hypothetical protein H7I53_26750 [Mycolicibacterium pulveris]|uniref:hypothetical protein n=1 Tax=Mycolicibacterium pulveris TaxID=36813 RepID=UPI0021F2615B|nr:hypothetical protein [Mycolicibacterium pulveris]MCV6983808.1 hypothetical protein [Mycolicibacterium pulveris]